MRWLLILAVLGGGLFLFARWRDGLHAPDYTGPMPSAAAQQSLRGLIGHTLRVQTGPLAGDVWQVEGFAVVANDASPSGVGPVMRLSRGIVSKQLPVENDSDAADLCALVLGTSEPPPAAKLSAAYRSRIGR